MRPKHILYSPTILDADSICASQTRASAGALVINGVLAAAGVATIPIPRHLSIYAASDEHLITFTIVGTDRYGKALTEAHIGPTAGATVKLAYNFATITSVTISGALTGNVTVGTSDDMETPWIPLNRNDSSLDLNAKVSEGGSMTVAIQSTRSDIWNTLESNIAAVDEAILSGLISQSSLAGLAVPVAVRLKITAFVSGTVSFDIIPHRI